MDKAMLASFNAIRQQISLISCSGYSAPIFRKEEEMKNNSFSLSHQWWLLADSEKSWKGGRKSRQRMGLSWFWIYFWLMANEMELFSGLSSFVLHFSSSSFPPFFSFLSISLHSRKCLSACHLSDYFHHPWLNDCFLFVSFLISVLQLFPSSMRAQKRGFLPTLLRTCRAQRTSLRDDFDDDGRSLFFWSAEPAPTSLRPHRST